MEEKVCVDILDVLKHAKEALDKNDAEALSDWSNRVMHCAAIYNEKWAIYVAITTYSLS